MRKPQIQPALATLTDTDREKLADLLRRLQYKQVLEIANQPRPEGLGLALESVKPLQTFYAKVALFDLVNSRVPDDKKLTLATWTALAAGEILLASTEPNDQSPTSELPSSQAQKVAAAHEAILDTAHDLATSGTQSPTQLLALQRLVDFPERAQIRAHRLQLDLHKSARQDQREAFRQQTTEKRLDLAERQFAFRQQQHQDRQLERQQKSAPKPVVQEDEWGPLARNAEELSARCRKVFNISDEEWARRQVIWAKHNEEKKLQEQQAALQPPKKVLTEAEEQAQVQAWFLSTLNPAPSVPNATPGRVSQPGVANADATPATTDPTPTPPPIPTTPEELDAAVFDYTTKRDRELNAWRQGNCGVDYTKTKPYRSALRHCPCGQPTPCPAHETGPNGPFPDSFWDLDPRDRAYEQKLTERGLPFRLPSRQP